MSDNEQCESDSTGERSAERLYEKYKEELLKRQLSNSEAYDKAILSLSSAGLALSVTVVKDLFPSPLEYSRWLIITSWILFCITISGVIFAFWVGSKAIDEQLKIAEEYYLNRNEHAFNRRNAWATVNRALNAAAGITFGFATLSVVIYAIVNFIE